MKINHLGSLAGLILLAGFESLLAENPMAGDYNISGYLTVTGGATNTNSTSTGTGALKVLGGAGIIKDVNIGGYLQVFSTGSAFGNSTYGLVSSIDALYGGNAQGDALDGSGNPTLPAISARGVYGRAVFSGTIDTTQTYTGVNGYAQTLSSSTGALTQGTSGGGLKNRFTVLAAGSGLVTLASAVNGQVTASTGASITNSAAFNADAPSISAGATIDTHYGMLIRGVSSTAGTLNNYYGIRVNSLGIGTNRYGLYIQSDPTYLGGNTSVHGTLRVPKSGDLPMGEFEVGTPP